MGTTSVNRPLRPSASRTAWPTSNDAPRRNEPHQAALDPPQVLRARDDFLAGEAALAEADAVDEIEIQHLRDVQFARRRVDLRQARANVREPPVSLYRVGVENVSGESAGGDERGLADDPKARVRADPADAEPCGFHVALGGVGRLQAGGFDRGRAMLARDHDLLAGILDPHLRAQDEFAQALHRRPDEFARQNAEDARRVRQQVQDRQHAPLGIRVCREQRPPGREAAGVVG